MRGQWESRSFQPLFEALSNHFRFIQYDDRGEGLSGRGLPDEITLDDFELDLEAVFEECCPEGCILVASMLSGHVAVRFAVRRPERVKALVLLQVNLDDPLEGVRYLEDLARVSWDNYLKMPAYSFYRLDPPEQGLRILKDALSPDDFFRRLNLPATSLRPFLPKVRCPTLVLAVRGPYGPRVSGEEEGMGIAALVPDASLIIKEPGEMIMQDGGLTLATLIISFVEKLPLSSPVAVAPEPKARLSIREVEVLRLLALGWSNQQIANELVLSVNTVIRHVSNVFDKTGVANRAQATAYAKDHGIA
jgi:DNA-binding CsgD family transcriptional regulator/pimeloyl-ACP methyl ester carboxylesterase